jgi:hypothetical protein
MKSNSGTGWLNCSVKHFNRRVESDSHMEEPIDSRQLRAFVILTKTGSSTETARQLFVTDSAISHAMRALESTVGVAF